MHTESFISLFYVSLFYLYIKSVEQAGWAKNQRVRPNWSYRRLTSELKIPKCSVTKKEDLFHSADDKLYRKILHNSAHVLQLLIPDRQPSSYDLRPCSHDKLLLNKTTYLNERDFVIRMLYRDSYWCVYLCKLGLCQICYTWLLTICFLSCVCQFF